MGKNDLQMLLVFSSPFEKLQWRFCFRSLVSVRHFSAQLVLYFQGQSDGMGNTYHFLIRCLNSRGKRFCRIFHFLKETISTSALTLDTGHLLHSILPFQCREPGLSDTINSIPKDEKLFLQVVFTLGGLVKKDLIQIRQEGDSRYKKSSTCYVFSLNIQRYYTEWQN